MPSVGAHPEVALTPSARGRASVPLVVVVDNLFAARRALAVESVAAEPIVGRAPFEPTVLSRGRRRHARCAVVTSFDAQLRGRRSAAAGHDLHYCANRIGAEERALRSAHDLDPLDVRRWHL